METPTPCPNCGVICEFDDMVNHPNEFTTLVCEDCCESIEQDNNCGFSMDDFGNKISWQAYPDDGLIVPYGNSSSHIRKRNADR